MAMIARNVVVATGGIVLRAANYLAYGEAFKSLLNTTIDTATFKIKKTGSPTGTCVVKIYSTIGTYGTDAKPGSLLATSDTLDVSTLTTTATNKVFTFSGAARISLSLGTIYTAVVEYTGGDASNNITVSYTAVGGYDGNYVGYTTVWIGGTSVNTYFSIDDNTVVNTNASFLLNMI